MARRRCRAGELFTPGDRPFFLVVPIPRRQETLGFLASLAITSLSIETACKWTCDRFRRREVAIDSLFQNANASSFLNHDLYELPQRQRASLSAFRQTRNWVTPAATIDLPLVDEQAELAWTWITLLIALGLGASLSRGRWVMLLIWLGVGSVPRRRC